VKGDFYMCLAVPAKVLDIKDRLGVVELSGIQRKVSFMLLPEGNVGDYVLVHAGFAIQVIDKKEAEETNALLREMSGLGREVE
jgi:hydrogenase expression/formation protein HypC